MFFINSTVSVYIILQYFILFKPKKDLNTSLDD